MLSCICEVPLSWLINRISQRKGQKRKIIQNSSATAELIKVTSCSLRFTEQNLFYLKSIKWSETEKCNNHKQNIYSTKLACLYSQRIIVLKIKCSKIHKYIPGPKKVLNG